MEQVNKVVRLYENPMGKKEEPEVEFVDGETNDNEISYMDKLPPEIMMKILYYLDEKQLIECRILNSQWNEICCLLLQDDTKDDRNSKLTVRFKKVGRGFSLSCKIVITKSLDDFLDCFSPSEEEKSSGRRRPFPFSRFTIKDMVSMEKGQMSQLVPLLAHIKTLYFVDIKQQDLNNFGTFWRLLLKFAPNIKHFAIGGDQWFKIDLFEPYFNVKSHSYSDLFQKMIDKTQTQKPEETGSFLNKLKVVEFKPLHYDGPFNPIETFLDHTPNVQDLGDGLQLDGYELLRIRQKQNLAHLVKKMEIISTPVGFSPDLMKNLRLEHLHANCEISSNSEENENEIRYINNALKSSQDTLSSLTLDDLSTKSMNLCFKGISSLPHVRQLKLIVYDDDDSIGNVLERLGQLCPNITSLDIERISDSFSIVAPIIWTGFKNLKSLKFTLDVTDKKNNLLAVDSAISGYSEKAIERIQTKLGGGSSMEEARRGESQNPSILVLKDLSRIELKFFIGEKSCASKKILNHLRNSVFVKILPQHIREYPRSIFYLHDYDDATFALPLQSPSK